MGKRDIFILLLAISMAVLIAFSVFRGSALPTGSWGLSFRQEGTAPIGNAGVDQLKQYDAAYIGDTTKKVLYLTFDAGYENGCTAKILDTLKKHEVKAAFFLVGNYIEKNADLVRRMVEEGHIVGNHSTTHPSFAEISREKMIKEIEAAARNHDSVGGILETVIIGLEPGIGEPEFDSVESRLAQAMFSVPAVKGIEFGAGFGFADMYGSQANDRFTVADGRIRTVTNNNGGINGGISNGMPVLFRTAVKPTPSIGLKQETVNFKTKENAVIETGGRHDPAVIHRARAVVDAMTAFVIADMLASHHGRQWLGEKI